jgi:hypothetical protein
MSDSATYTVGLICALQVEYVVAQVFLDKEHERTSFVSPNDTNEYTLDKISGHNIVISLSPDGEYGTASAANVGDTGTVRKEKKTAWEGYHKTAPEVRAARTNHR